MCFSIYIVQSRAVYRLSIALYNNLHLQTYQSPIHVSSKISILPRICLHFSTNAHHIHLLYSVSIPQYKSLRKYLSKFLVLLLAHVSIRLRIVLR